MWSVGIISAVIFTAEAVCSKSSFFSRRGTQNPQIKPYFCGRLTAAVIFLRSICGCRTAAAAILSPTIRNSPYGRRSKYKRDRP